MTNGHGAPKLETLSKEDLVRLRDDEGNSWAKVAEALNLGSPGSARRIYSQLVRPHTESVLEGRTTSGAKVTPVHLADANVTAIRKAIVGKTIVVQRANDRTEDIAVAKVTSLAKGTVNFNDGSKARSVKAAAIIATKP